MRLTELDQDPELPDVLSTVRGRLATNDSDRLLQLESGFNPPLCNHLGLRRNGKWI
jgi:hypothetical protein